MDGKLDLDGLNSFKVLVTGGEGENARTTTYTYTSSAVRAILPSLKRTLPMRSCASTTKQARS